MDGQIVQLSVGQYIEAMRGEFEQAMRQIGDAVNRAEDGRWIDASEEEVRDTMDEFRCKAYQTALQMRLDQAEGAFSPGGPSDIE